MESPKPWTTSNLNTWLFFLADSVGTSVKKMLHLKKKKLE